MLKRKFQMLVSELLILLRIKKTKDIVKKLPNINKLVTNTALDEKLKHLKRKYQILAN